MNDLVIFILIVFLGLIPFGLGVIWTLYRKTIVFKMALLVFLASMMCTIVAFAVGEYGFKSLLWAIPSSLAFLLTTNFFIKRWIQKPIKELRHQMEKVSVGNLNVKFTSRDLKDITEVGDIFKSFDQLVKNLHNTTKFADSIANGDFEKEHQLLSDNDELGKSLLNMRKSLIVAREAEIARKAEEEKAAWAARGMAKFSELMRLETNDIVKLSRMFISQLADYVGAIQGAVFMLNEDNPNEIKYVLTGAVAYKRLKQTEKEFGLGYGLVGQCAYEKMPVLLNEIPENYVEITSGLGEASPRFIVLVPAILNETVFAVIELAAFTPIEQYKSDFILKIGEGLASTLSMVKINQRTNRLLEESKEKAEQLAAQQEMMRQSFEELQTLQEDLNRKEMELRDRESSLR
jgi:methyl-accepting chemotaxis protein